MLSLIPRERSSNFLLLGSNYPAFFHLFFFCFYDVSSFDTHHRPALSALRSHIPISFILMRTPLCRCTKTFLAIPRLYEFRNTQCLHECKTHTNLLESWIFSIIENWLCVWGGRVCVCVVTCGIHFIEEFLNQFGSIGWILRIKMCQHVYSVAIPVFNFTFFFQISLVMGSIICEKHNANYETNWFPVTRFSFDI